MSTQGDLLYEKVILEDDEADMVATEVLSSDDEEPVDDDSVFYDAPDTWPDAGWGHRHQATCEDPECVCWDDNGQWDSRTHSLGELLMMEGANLARMKLQGQARVTLKLSTLLGRKGKDLALTVGGVAPWWLDDGGNLLYVKYVCGVLRISRESDEDELRSKNELLLQDSAFLKVYTRHFFEYILGFF